MSASLSPFSHSDQKEVLMYTYIIIDDEELIRKGTIKKISPLGETVSCIGEAGNGNEGLSLIEEKNPDFVILDMQMPVMGGSELLPILAEKYPDMPLIVISGFRNFDYIKQAISSKAIDYILKPFSRESIQDCVRQAIAKLENTETISRRLSDSEEQRENARYDYDLQYLTNLMLGYHTGDGSITSQKLKFLVQEHRFVLLTLYFGTSANELSVKDWIQDPSMKDTLLFLFSNSRPQTCFLIIFMPNEAAFHSGSIIKGINSNILSRSREDSLQVLIGTSRIHSDIQELPEAFKETCDALNMQELAGSYAVPVYSPQPPRDPHPFQWDRQDEFLFRVEAGMEKEVRALTLSLFEEFRTTAGFTLMDAKYFCSYLSGLCQDIMDQYLKQQRESSSRSVQNIVSQIFRLENLRQYYLQFFVNITVLLKKDSIYAVDDVVEKIQVYMEHNYQKDLTQDFIASLFYMNRSYLSTLFKARTGTKFIDYLNDVRIGKAKEYLSDSERKMYQISRQVGYDNVKYFFRIFKKRTGMTPEQYRQKCQEGSS